MILKVYGNSLKNEKESTTVNQSYMKHSNQNDLNSSDKMLANYLQRTENQRFAKTTTVSRHFLGGVYLKTSI